MGHFFQQFREYGVNAVIVEYNSSQTYKASSIKYIKCILIFYVSPFVYLCLNINNITGFIKEIKYMHVIKKLKSKE